MIESKYEGYVIKVESDCDPMNPRTEWDNATEMICFHGRYRLGDEHDFRHEDYGGWDQMREALEEDAAVILPLYLYDHSGITMNTTGFACGWDSSQVGFIRITKETAEKEWPGYSEEELENVLRGDVETYDRYLTGQVYGYDVYDSDGNLVDSCRGFYSDEEDVEKEARAVVDAIRSAA